MRSLLPFLALLLGACQAPVGLVRDRGPDTLAAFWRSLRSPEQSDQTEALARRLTSDPTRIPFTCDFPIPASQIRTARVASDYRANLLFRHYTRPGPGVPLVVELAPTASHHPPEGRFLPVTAVLREGSLHLADPLNDPSIAADFTVPFAFHADTHVDDSARFKGLVLADRLTPSFHIHDPYDPDKIPLVMVHGLGSSPATWNQLSNLVFGDPYLRSRYQVWHYFYPTGVPFLEAARDFRDRFSRFRRTLADETGLSEPRHPAVFVAHSLGGLMVKTLASDSGERLQRASGLSSHDPALHFTRSPHIARAVFVASPLNGSTLAAFPGAEIASFIPSIPTIAKDHPVTEAFSTIPIATGIPFHMILGKKFALSDTHFSDGVVSYHNAQLPGAESTKIVRTNTHNVHTEPEALVEIQRVLYLHLSSRYTNFTE